MSDISYKQCRETYISPEYTIQQEANLRGITLTVTVVLEDSIADYPKCRAELPVPRAMEIFIGLLVIPLEVPNSTKVVEQQGKDGNPE